nr:MAG TPA: hypothetical protein [Caudoviricetes sp.]
MAGCSILKISLIIFQFILTALKRLRNIISNIIYI